MRKVRLTARRRQFLGKLVDLYRQTKLPVHYGSVARALGVSKWTAYDMLTVLERLGYVRRDYVVNPDEGGRSLIVFSPTPEADRLFADPPRGVPAGEGTAAVRAQIDALLKRLEELRPAGAVEQLLRDLHQVESRVLFSAHVLGVLVAYVRQLGDRTRQLIGRLVTAAPELPQRLSVFVAAVTGMAIRQLSKNLSVQWIDLAARFLQYLEDLDSGEQELLGQFLEQALEEST